jgi:1-acyl-sn-glycerol-3-phosphate acyltransferase
MQHVRSLIFNAAMYVWMAVIGIGMAPVAIFSTRVTRWVMNTYCRGVLWLLRVIVGLRVEFRGTPPTGGALVASKHQSFLDVMALWITVPRGFFIMKAILKYAPILGQYGLRVGCIPVERGGRGEAIRRMIQEVRSGRRQDGQLLIYPQGTRVAAGAHVPYKVGTFALYEQLGQPCYPVATNIGVFWPKRGVLRRPGTAVMEYLEPIPTGLKRPEFMAALEGRIERASNLLMIEAGMDAASLPAPRFETEPGLIAPAREAAPAGPASGEDDGPEPADRELGQHQHGDRRP